MSKQNLSRSLSCVLLSLAMWASQAAALTGRVVGVHDGDTITVLDAERRQHKIHLAGIDAPDLRQASGTRSKQYLSGLVFHQDVNIEWDKVDRYGRIVGKVWTVAPCFVAPCPLAKDANLAQITAGMAWHYKQYEREQSPADRRSYPAAEEDARARRVGIWADLAPVSPWLFRKEPRGRLSDTWSPRAD